MYTSKVTLEKPDLYSTPFTNVLTSSEYVSLTFISIQLPTDSPAELPDTTVILYFPGILKEICLEKPEHLSEISCFVELQQLTQ